MGRFAPATEQRCRPSPALETNGATRSSSLRTRITASFPHTLRDGAQPRRQQCDRHLSDAPGSHEARADSKHSAMPTSRRRLLFGAASLLGISKGPLNANASWGQQPHEEAEMLDRLQAFWDLLVLQTRKSVGDDFRAALTFYQPGMDLPSGTPGDPAMDFASSGRGGSGSCGNFQPGALQPYALCPITPGGSPVDMTPEGLLSRDCCRHYAFCVPYSRFAFADIDRQSTVVASPRMAALPQETWKAILVHEMGHAIDFYVFGGRYGLYDHKASLAPGVAAALKEIDAAESDAEFRADDFANALLAGAIDGAQICYSPKTALQVLADKTAMCSQDTAGDGRLLESPEGESTGSSRLLKHWPHAPVQGGY